ncbi:MAG: N-acetylneuraminate synthase family protein [Spirochaetaceae bacterium]|jgi:sialic acid synthase SpsE|nr:N-acetylneuraminate synthase family protein [Spirochaetaceae bacterium]
MKHPFVVAEIGTAHGGDINKAKDLIDAAVSAGADCVKFQIVYADEILHYNSGIVPLPGGNIPLYDTFKKLESSPEFFALIKEYAESKKVVFLASPFGLKSAGELKALKPACVKIASPELNYAQLLREIAFWHIPVFLSTGVSLLKDIEAALAIFAAANSLNDVTLLHCITAYPAPAEEYNLNLLPNLESIFGVKTGVSDHTLDPVLVPVLALCKGATVIEKHFCLNRKDGGLDDPIALNVCEFEKMTSALRDASRLLLAAKTNLQGAEAVIASLEEEYGKKRVERVLGNGRKQLALAEAANYGRTNRSIHALCEIKKGEVFSGGNLAVLRTEKVLRPGVEPAFLPHLIGRSAARLIPSGEGVRWEDVGTYISE